MNVTSTKVQTLNGVAMCTFTRGPSVSKNINGKMTEFNLLVKEFYILQAFGNVTNGKCIYKCFSSLFTEQKSLMTRNVIKIFVRGIG